MFGFNSKNDYAEILKGIKIKTLCSGETTNIVEFILEKNSVLPEHSHPNEQTGYLVKGKIRLFINGVAKELAQGNSWSIKKNFKHKAEVIEDSIAVEVFNPLREDYLKYINENDVVI